MRGPIPVDSGAPSAAPGSVQTSIVHLLTNACFALLRKTTTGVANSEDVLQEACLRVLELKEPEAIREPDRYASRIAKNLFVDGLRKQRRSAALFVDFADTVEIPDEQPSAERVLCGKDTLGQVMAEIDRLPPRCKQAFILHRFENLPYPIIARTMGISISTVEKHIADAMGRLARALDPERRSPV